MLTLGQSIIDKPVLSLRTGAPIGQILDVLINPNNLKIEGWHIMGNGHKQSTILLSQDVRDLVPRGIVVNDHDALSRPDELVRLQKIIKLEFTLIGKNVVTEQKKKLGKVTDYSFDKISFMIQKLYVGQSIVKSFSGGNLLVDRSQIVEITHNQIVVSDATAPGKVISNRVAEASPQQA